MVRLLLAVLLMWGASVQAQNPSEFEAFPTADAGVAPPPFQYAPLQVDAGVPQPPPPPQLGPAHWSSFTGDVTGELVGLKNVALGFTAGVAWQVGTGVPVPAGVTSLEGWLFSVGPQFDYFRVGGPDCLGSAFCASRVGGGASFKFGRAWGSIGRLDGMVPAQRMVFGKLDVVGAYYSIPDAPLAPGLSSGELLLRLSLGGHVMLTEPQPGKSGLPFVFALVLEGIPVSGSTKGVSLGASVGLQF